jgi:sigma-B regulation protein RsbU (phosphoserine phosphatase)
MAIKVLVVDDETDVEALMRQKFRRQIRDGKYEFFFARDGEEALDVIRAVPTLDIMITDINMPRMDGLTLLQRIKDANLKLNCVVVSAYGDIANIRTAMNRGAFDFLTKPIDFNDFEITLAKTWDQTAKAKKAARESEELQSIMQELHVASIIQKAILPSQFPAFPGRTDFSIYAANLPAKEVSGDFYDFFLAGQNKLVFTICDVSGKGVPSALYMAVCRTLLRSNAEDGKAADELVATVNRTLCQEDYASMFATLLVGILDTGTGKLDLCCAGHELPYLLRKDANWELVSMPRNLAVGIESVVPYRSIQLTLAPGETLVLYTDGVTEAQDTESNFYLIERLHSVLQSNRSLGTEALVGAVRADVERFANGAQQADDITILALQFRGGAG